MFSRPAPLASGMAPRCSGRTTTQSRPSLLARCTPPRLHCLGGLQRNSPLLRFSSCPCVGWIPPGAGSSAQDSAGEGRSHQPFHDETAAVTRQDLFFPVPPGPHPRLLASVKPPTARVLPTGRPVAGPCGHLHCLPAAR
ncbi:hypothetical protein HJG60_010416 [Phyllostomus discolor]|uniref:Uncharacterized protein n=1 Tax=Phyllostomus discolor TaxID=89673 RepID=A0A834AX16_9CHIR|nr:hypothetical protein HJG60_010416 [Phyllostomus discolor]